MNALKDPGFDLIQLFEATPDLVCIAGKDGYFRHINQAVIKILGYSREELFAVPIANFIHPEDREVTGLRRADLLHGKTLTDFHNRYVRKDGQVIWLHWTSVYLPEKEVVFAIAKDITVKKSAELEIEEEYRKFKSLAKHFKESLEKDRKYLAFELHEELAQLASVVKKDLELVRDGQPNIADKAKERLEHGISVSGLLINAIRRITYEISPAILEDLGLRESLRWLCSEFSVINGITCSFDGGNDLEHLSPELKLDVFRICQQALRSVIYHAEAQHVAISLELQNQTLRLDINQKGISFEQREPIQNIDLLAIRERVAYANGELNIHRSNSQHTNIRVIIPAEPKPA